MLLCFLNHIKANMDEVQVWHIQVEYTINKWAFGSDKEVLS